MSTWYLSVKEKLPTIYPISHILAKALAEEVIVKEGFNIIADPFFQTQITLQGVKIP